MHRSSEFFITYVCFKCEAQWGSLLWYDDCYLCHSEEIGELKREKPFGLGHRYVRGIGSGSLFDK